jgi:hypothetical protein
MRMKSVFAVGLMAGIVLLGTGCPQWVFFQDRALESAIRAELQMPFGVLTTEDLKGVSDLDARNLAIRDLSGIENCANLARLNLDTNEISDLSSLEQLGLAQQYLSSEGEGEGEGEGPKPQSPLVYLNLDNNQITDVSALAGLLNLEGLSLAGNLIVDIAPLVTNARNGGLGSGDYVVIDLTALHDGAANTDLKELENLGVTVITDGSSTATTGTGTGG